MVLALLTVNTVSLRTPKELWDTFTSMQKTKLLTDTGGLYNPLLNGCVSQTSQLPVKFLNSKIFYVFQRILFCSPSLHLFDPKYSKSSNTVKLF